MLRHTVRYNCAKRKRGSKNERRKKEGEREKTREDAFLLDQIKEPVKLFFQSPVLTTPGAAFSPSYSSSFDVVSQVSPSSSSFFKKLFSPSLPLMKVFFPSVSMWMDGEEEGKGRKARDTEKKRHLSLLSRSLRSKISLFLPCLIAGNLGTLRLVYLAFSHIRSFHYFDPSRRIGKEKKIDPFFISLNCQTSRTSC